MNIVAGVDVLQLTWLALALAIVYWLMRLGFGLAAKSSGPVGTVGAAMLKIIPGG